jgi:sarcosine oxidase
MQTFDAIVLGLGTMGSFTCLELARRGVRVAGLDRFSPPHGRGSHSGDTRIFRIAYAEHPDYVPLAQRAGQLWDQHGLDFGKTLLTRTGMLSMGPPNESLVAGIRTSALTYGLEVETLTSIEIRRLYPAFAPPEEYVGLFESAAGWVDVNASIESALTACERSGAHLSLDTPVTGWSERGGRIFVETANGAMETARLVITAGAWAGAVLSDLRLPFSVRRKTLAWFDPAEPKYFESGELPVFLFGDRFFYGFPSIAGQGVKLAIHWEEGIRVPDPSLPVAPAGVEDLAPIVDCASRYLRGLTNLLGDGRACVRRAATCLYTMTPDEHFIIDRHPNVENVWIAAGFSGHGFKFAPAIAEALADLCETGHTGLPIEFLRLGSRFSQNAV